jgi:hypothetical protein
MTQNQHPRHRKYVRCLYYVYKVLFVSKIANE